MEKSFTGVIIHSADGSFPEKRFDPVAQKNLPTGKTIELWLLVLQLGSDQYHEVRVTKRDRLDEFRTNPLWTEAQAIKEGDRVTIVCSGEWNSWKHIQDFSRPIKFELVGDPAS